MSDLDTMIRSHEAAVEVVAGESNVGPKLGPPQGHLFGEGGSEHRVQGAVTNLCGGV